MKKLILLLLFFPFILFAKHSGNSENQLKVYNYVLENLNVIKKNNPEEVIGVSLKFNKNQLLRKVSYYACTLNMMSYPLENKNEISVPVELNKFIENSFSLFPENIFSSNSYFGSNYEFFIPLDKENLMSQIKKTNKDIKYWSNSDQIGIVSNTKFELQINNLYFDKSKCDNKLIKSKLNLLNSDLIEIAPDLYFIFRIIKTNQFNSNESVDFLEYKILYLNGISSELFGGNRFQINDSKQIEINEHTTYSGYDNLSDMSCVGVDDDEILNPKFEGFKFDFELKFTN